VTTIAVIVSFNPDLRQFQRNFDALAAQVDDIVVVDNSPDKFTGFHIANYLWLPENAGVGRAQNLGVIRAEALGADTVLFSDQDSQFRHDAVSILSKALHACSNVAAVGPVYRELNSNQLSSFFRLQGLRCERTPGTDLSLGETVRTDFLISSGMLVKQSALAQVGQMREDYFIDYVDTEWCIRATRAGLSLLGVGGELMTHSVGDGFVRIWIGHWRWVAKHKPFRYFFAFRNGFDLLIRGGLPLVWRVYLARRLVGFLGLLLLFDRRLSVIMCALEGIVAGLSKRFDLNCPSWKLSK
jgi:rhamnosyltransferase